MSKCESLIVSEDAQFKRFAADALAACGAQGIELARPVVAEQLLREGATPAVILVDCDGSRAAQRVIEVLGERTMDGGRLIRVVRDASALEARSDDVLRWPFACGDLVQALVSTASAVPAGRFAGRQ